MSTNPSKAAAPKRRSTLAGLGIKPNGPVTPSTSKQSKPSPEPTGPVKRTSTPARASKTPAARPRPLSMAGSPSPSSQRAVPGSPTVQRSTSSSKPPMARKPASISTSRTPASPTATAAKRRSMISTSTSSQQPTSPLLRRGSTAKRMSSPASTPSPSNSSSLRWLEQVKELKQKLADKEKELEERDLVIHDLQVKMTDLSASDKSSDPATPLLSSSSMLIPCDSSVESERFHDDLDKVKHEYQNEIQNIRKQLKQVQEEKDAATVEAKDQETLKTEIRRQVDEQVSAEHKAAMDLLLEEQERKWQAEIQILRGDQEKISAQTAAEHAKQLADIQRQVQEKQEALDQEKEKQKVLDQERQQLAKFGGEKEQIILERENRIAELEKTLDDSRNVSSLRRLERQLSDNQAAFDEFKRQAAQATDALERRFRDEVQQLQSGSDDTAEAWLSKNRAAQQEIDRLQAASIDLERTHAAKLQDIKDDYDEQLTDLKAKCETHEIEMDSQAHQIESLLSQVDDLQNSLEAATKRLERNTSKKQLEDKSPSVSADGHRLCEEKLQTQRQEMDELHRRIAELKQSNEGQLNRLGHEKARELQELRKEMVATQELLEATKRISDERLSSIAQQHKKEIHVMHEQYQKLVDIKDRELEDYAYRVKAIAATKQKEMDRLRDETNEKLGDVEGQIEGYETRIDQFERQTDELQKKYTAVRDENTQLESLISRLQGELHRGAV